MHFLRFAGGALPDVDVAPGVGMEVSPATDVLLLERIVAAAGLRGEGVSIEEATLSGVEAVEEMVRFGVEGGGGSASSSGRFWEATRATGVESSIVFESVRKIELTGCVQYNKFTVGGAIDMCGLRSVIMVGGTRLGEAGATRQERGRPFLPPSWKG